MEKLILATSNLNKVEELKKMTSGQISVIPMSELGFFDEIEETGTDLSENARIKARYIYEKTNEMVLADDSGLEVSALNGEPGVFSARYAGLEKNHQKNIELVLKKLKGKENRKANFRTVLILKSKNEELLFEGIINGKISEKQKGQNGFGYDSIFIPDGYTETFAEMNSDLKNQISHRALAFKKLLNYINLPTKL